MRSPPRGLTRLISAYARAPPGRCPPTAAVPAEPTPRERENRHLPAPGLDNADIARDLDISVSTVKNRITGIFGKQGVRDRARAVTAVYGSGLVAARGVSS
ncbi:response regulator transcription factor [Streptomyces sp. NPDC058701]|uniref:response regulator transcription factor n=1 Tax=Streptomyces sp. NPDC058701 TaxID=3346608 RepID=UPI003668D752